MGDSRRRRLIASCLCFCLLLLGAGCSEKDTQEGDIVLEFWTIALGDAFADYINGMIADYEELNPGVRVEWVDVSGGEVAEKFIAALVSGDPPDLANVYDLPRFLEHDVLSNLDSLVSGTDQDRYLPNFWRGMGQYQGANYAFPFYGSVNMMWYNKEIFAAAGLDPERPPTTMTEMFEMGRVIREKTGKYGVSWRLHPSLVGPPWWLLRMDDVWPLFNPDGTATTINNAEALALFEQWVDAYAMGVLPPEALAASSRDEVNWFIEGRAAMLPFSGGWITRYFDESFETKAGMTSHPLGRLGK
ncbi:MAG: extracellular solute-binding protein, partial [Gemmatimonadetes bacterium]|nr:extracellular solute-binding protein [Gemmatimonadota bacterium]